MDDLTRERFPFEPPIAEANRRPRPNLPVITLAEVLEHRLVLCGTTDLAAPSRGQLHASAKAARLLRVIRGLREAS